MAKLQTKWIADQAVTAAKLGSDVAGDGLQGGSGAAVAVKLEASNPSLQTASGELGVKIDSAGGLQKGTGGTGIKLEASNPSMQIAGNELGVKIGTNKGLAKTSGGMETVGTDIAGDGLAAGAQAHQLKVDNTVVRTSGVNAFTADQSMGGFKLTSLGAPSAAGDAATKSYVDGIAEGLDVKGSCRLATAAALPANTRTSNTLTASANGALTVDGVAVANGNRVLVKNEATGANNGIYTVTDAGSAGTPFILDRAADFDSDADIDAGDFVFVEEGTANADSGWLLTTDETITLNTTALTFTQFSGAGQVTPGAGLTKTGNTLDVGAGDGIAADADAVRVKLAASAGLQFFTGEVGVIQDTRTGDSVGVRSDASGNFVPLATDFDGDHLDVDYAETNYTPVSGGLAADADDLAAHLKGIDNRLGTLANADDARVEYHKITAAETTAGSFALAAAPRAVGEVCVTVLGGPRQVNGALNVAGQTADFEVTSSTLKFNANSSPSETLTGDLTTDDILEIAYTVAP